MKKIILILFMCASLNSFGQSFYKSIICKDKISGEVLTTNFILTPNFITLYYGSEYLFYDINKTKYIPEMKAYHYLFTDFNTTGNILMWMPELNSIYFKNDGREIVFLGCSVSSNSKK